MSAVDERPRELPAGDPRSLPTLDALVRELNAKGKDVHVVYVGRSDTFKVIEKKSQEEIQYHSDLGRAA